MFIVVGVVLIRHLDLSRALIGLFIGITWASSRSSERSCSGHELRAAVLSLT